MAISGNMEKMEYHPPYGYSVMCALPIVGTIMTLVNFNHVFCCIENPEHSYKSEMKRHLNEIKVINSEIITTVVDRPEAQPRISHHVTLHEERGIKLLDINLERGFYGASAAISNLFSLVVTIILTAKKIFALNLLAVPLVGFSALMLFGAYSTYRAYHEWYRCQDELVIASQYTLKT